MSASVIQPTIRPVSALWTGMRRTWLAAIASMAVCSVSSGRQVMTGRDAMSRRRVPTGSRPLETTR